MNKFEKRLKAAQIRLDKNNSTQESGGLAFPLSSVQKEEKHRLSAKEIESIQLELLLKLLKGEITEGRLLRILRKQVLDYSQTEFAKMVGVSRKTISDFETNSGSKTLQTVNKLFKPFGLRTGIVPKQPEQIEKLTRKLNVE